MLQVLDTIGSEFQPANLKECKHVNEKQCWIDWMTHCNYLTLTFCLKVKAQWKLGNVYLPFLFPKVSFSKTSMGQYSLQRFSNSISFDFTRPGSCCQDASYWATELLKMKQKCIEMNSMPCLYMKKSASSWTLRFDPDSDLVNLPKCSFSSGKELLNSETSAQLKLTAFTTNRIQPIQ
jgi:hypothetical protein